MPLRALLDLLFPPLCHACKRFIPGAGPLRLCAGCLSRTAFIESPLCRICGIPFATEHGLDHVCGACRVLPPYDACRSAALLAGPVQELIHRFKYRGQPQLRRPLGLLALRSLQGFLADAAPELILPVPLHRRRLRARGYNQSQLVAEVLGKEVGVRVVVGNLERSRYTEAQTGLSASARKENVTGAFALREAAQLKGKRVLLVDDVLTTGSTVRACAEVLRDADVAALFVATVARGVPP